MTSITPALNDGLGSIVGRPLTPAELDRFDKYVRLLQKWQRAHRLVGSADAAWIVRNVIVDSALFLRVLRDAVRDVLDIGSGAGIPGVTIKILRSEIRLTMAEARRRRASFLAAAIRELELDDASVINARVESGDSSFADRFDAVVSRCAGDPSKLLELGLSVVRPGGVVVVSGPPRPLDLRVGDWVTVAGAGPRTTRRFAVAQRPDRDRPTSLSST